MFLSHLLLSLLPVNDTQLKIYLSTLLKEPMDIYHISSVKRRNKILVRVLLIKNTLDSH